MNEPIRVTGLHVLVVDDDREQLSQLEAMLRDLGCRVDTAAGGAEAVRKHRQLKPELVVMDLGMPTISGWDAIREIRKERGASTYIIALSAYEDAEARRAAFDAGCNEYILKPLDVRGALRAYVFRRARPPLVGAG